MFIVTFVLFATPVLGLTYLLRRVRKPADASSKKGLRKRAIPPDVRTQIRRKIVKEADELFALEEEIDHFGEGSEPDVHPEKAVDAIIEAARLRTKLEAQCRRDGLPIGLVRRRRSATLNPTVGLLEKDEPPPS
jgi:hypothetical protein